MSALPLLYLDHEPLKFPPSHQSVILSNAKDLLLQRQKQILHGVYPRAQRRVQEGIFGGHNRNWIHGKRFAALPVWAPREDETCELEEVQ